MVATRAERRLGEILRDTPKATGGQPYQSTGAAKEPVETPTLEEMGIDKKLSSHAQKVAPPLIAMTQLINGAAPRARGREVSGQPLTSVNDGSPTRARASRLRAGRGLRRGVGFCRLNLQVDL